MLLGVEKREIQFCTTISHYFLNPDDRILEIEGNLRKLLAKILFTSF